METADQIRALEPEQAFVMMSGWAPEMLGAVKTAGTVWLPKPYSLGEFAAAVQRAIRSPSVPPSRRAAG
jgi:hypothetical protein